MVSDLDKLDKQQLIDKAKSLQAQNIDMENVENTKYLLHELQVHQIELEMQNRELRESQALLEETRDRYADLYDFAPVTILNLDKKGVVKNINLTGAEALGDLRSRIIDKPFTKWVVKDSVSDFFNHLHKTLWSDNKTYNEIKIKSRSGKEIDMRIESSRCWSHENLTYTSQSVLVDITEQKRSKNEISLKARQLQLITDALPVLVAYINIDNKYEFVNKTYLDWFEVKAEEILHKSIGDVWDKNKYPDILNKISRALTGVPLTFDMELPGLQSQTKYLSATLIPDFDEDKKIQGVIMMIGDITDRLLIESVDRKRLLEAAHYYRLNAMGEMASEIAHELNQPLAAISIYSDACRRMLESKKYNVTQIIHTLTDINKQAGRAGDVIRRIREFTSKKELKILLTSINVLVEESMRLIQIELRSHNVKLKLDLDSTLPKIMLDRILIEQVILNLSRNAIEAMESTDESRRFLKIRTFMNQENEVQVNVEDTGPGMDDDDIKRMFEMFHTTKDNGMGMGLTISHSIVSAHYGRLWADKGAHGETIFKFTLPVITENNNE